MNTTELTALNTETINAIAVERTLRNIERRADTLFSEGGYTFEKFSDDFYHVDGPQGQHYTVLTGGLLGVSCDCKSFASLRTCKHLMAVDKLIRDEQQAAEYDALYADADDDRYAEL